MPATPWSQPAMTRPAPSGNRNGAPRFHDASNSSPVECATPDVVHRRRCCPGVASAPSPAVMSSTTRSVGGGPSIGVDVGSLQGHGVLRQESCWGSAAQPARSVGQGARRGGQPRRPRVLAAPARAGTRRTAHGRDASASRRNSHLQQQQVLGHHLLRRHVRDARQRQHAVRAARRPAAPRTAAGCARRPRCRRPGRAPAAAAGSASRRVGEQRRARRRPRGASSGRPR